jgi:NADH:ubiquinone oxidoreductase subunit 6 (subunit J)
MHISHTAAFLSYLRLSIYMCIVAVAIVISFHLKNAPSKSELRMALPLGIVFWGLAVSCLMLGFGNYVKTVTKYSRRMALVQTGWKTQVVSISTFLEPNAVAHCE